MDLLVLRRPPVAGSPGTAHGFLTVQPLLDGDRAAHVNQYWSTHPAHVLGTLRTRPNPWGPPDVTVHPDPRQGLFTSIARGLEDVVAHARTTGQTAQTPATLDARPSDLRHRDPDRPIDYTLVENRDLDAVRRRIDQVRAERPRPNRNVAGRAPEEPPPGVRPRPTDNPGPSL